MSGTLSFPGIIGPAEIDWSLRAATLVHESPFTGMSQTLEQPASAWEVTVTWPTLGLTDRRLLEAFVAQLRGRAGRFFYGPVHAPRRATGGGTPLVNGAGQSGTTLSTRGWSAGATVMLTGDFLSYTDTSGRVRLHMVTADATANGSGVAALAITPPIRRAGADGAAVQIAAPVGVFRLTTDQVSIRTRPPLFGAATLSFVEALV